MADLTEVANAYFDAWNRHDAEGIVETFASGGTYSDPTTGGDLTGEAIGRYAAGLWEAFPDLSFEIVSVGVSGPGIVAAQWLMEGTNSGPFRDMPPTGREISLAGADFLSIDESGIRSVVGYFDSASVPRQLGLNVIVQPTSIGPFSFGTSTSVQSGRRTRPGAFSITQLIARSDEEWERLRSYSRQTAQEMLGMEGFIGLVTAGIGDRAITISAWDDPENPKQLLREGTHPEAMKAFWSEIGSGGYTSVWTSERFNPTFVRCTACQKMVAYEKKNGVCSCGESLPEPAPYW